MLLVLDYTTHAHVVCQHGKLIATVRGLGAGEHSVFSLAVDATTHHQVGRPDFAWFTVSDGAMKPDAAPVPPSAGCDTPAEVVWETRVEVQAHVQGGHVLDFVLCAHHDPSTAVQVRRCVRVLDRCATHMFVLSIWEGLG